MSDETPQRANKFFTGARRIPLMVGRLATGEQIPFGPYRITQFVVAGVVLLVCVITNPLWTTNNALLDLVVGAIWVGALGFLSGKLPLTKRSAWAMGRSFFQAMNAPAHGTVRGKEISIRKPHRARGVKSLHKIPLAPDAEHAVIGTERAHAQSPEQLELPVTPAEVIEPVSLIAAAPHKPSRPRPTTALEALLAQATSSQ